MADVVFELNTKEMQRALRMVSVAARRDFKDTMNRFCFYVGRRSIWYTHKASRAELDANFGVTNLTPGKFRSDGRPSRRLAYGNYALGTWLSKRGGKPALRGSELKAFMKRVFAARLRSIGFIKSGWLPGVKTLSPLVPQKFGLPPMDKGLKERGPSKKGYARPAVDGWSPVCVIANTANAKRDHKLAILKYGLPGLRQAVAMETVETIKYAEKKMAQSLKTHSAK